jgi:flagellar basal-body rod protein FlgB
MSEIAVVSGSFTGDLILRALDATSMRHAALAANVANATTDGYRALKVTFEDQLAAASNSLLNRDDAVSRRALESLRPRIEAESASRHIQLDQEMSALMQNALRYQALLTALSKNGAFLRAAVQEGRS